ncbi:homeobox protein NOBOX [Lissotriton helveticus]
MEEAEQVRLGMVERGDEVHDGEEEEAEDSEEREFFPKPSLLCTEHLELNMAEEQSDGASDLGSDLDLSSATSGTRVVPEFRTVIIEDDSSDLLEGSEGLDQSAMLASQPGDYCLVQVTEPDPGETLMAPSGVPEDCQLNFVTVCNSESGFFTRINTIPRASTTATDCGFSKEAPGQQDQKLPYYMGEDDEFDGSELHHDKVGGHSSASGDVFGMPQFHPVNLKIDPGNAPRRSARCAAASTTGRALLRLSSFMFDASSHSGTKAEKKREIPDETGLLAPVKKKTRTLYSAEQLQELERAFQEDHYPDGDKRKDIASTIGVTPQRIMVWFQNRRAKWRKVEKQYPKGSKKCPVASATLSASAPGAFGQLPVPYSSCDGKEVELLSAHPGALPGHQPAFLRMTSQPGVYGKNMLSEVCAPASATPHLQVGASLAGPLTAAEVEQTPKRGRMGNMPNFQSPPPLRRASLPLSMAFSSTNHIIPLMLDTPESTCTPPAQDGPANEVFSYSIPGSGLSPPCSYQDPLGPSGVKMGPQYYPHAGAGSNPSVAFQVGHFQPHQYHHLPLHITHGVPPSLTPTTPSDVSGTAFLALSGNLSYGGGPGRAGGGQILVQQGGGTGSIAAFQAVPWTDLYIQRAPFTSQLCQRGTQFARPSCRYSTDHGLYTQAATGPAHPVPRFFPLVKGNTSAVTETAPTMQATHPRTTQAQSTYQAQHGQLAEYSIADAEKAGTQATQECEATAAFPSEMKN